MFTYTRRVAAGDDFDVRLEPLPAGGEVARVTGELDLATAPRLERLLEEREQPASTLVIDLSGVTFVDSSGVRVLVREARRAQEAGTRLALVSEDPAVLRLLEITALTEMVPVHPTLDAAL